MKKIFNVIVMVQALLLFVSCFREQEGHLSFALVNKSSQSIACQMFEFRKSMEDDTLFKYWQVTDINVRPDSLVRYVSSEVPWEIEINNCAYVQLMILNNDSLNKCMVSSIDTVHKKVPILHIYQLKQTDLEKMNWTVIYPPLGDLKNSRVSPDYRKIRK